MSETRTLTLNRDQLDIIVVALRSRADALSRLAGDAMLQGATHPDVTARIQQWQKEASEMSELAVWLIERWGL